MAKTPKKAPKTTAKARTTKAAPKAPGKAKTAKSKKVVDPDGDTQIDVTRIGRPPKLVESDALIKQIMGLALIGCTLDEAANALFVHVNTFRTFLEENERSLEAWEMGPEIGKMSLRRMQWKTARAGNVRMQIWLGKQRLGQADKMDHRHAGANGGPIRTINGQMTPQEAAQAYADSIRGNF